MDGRSALADGAEAVLLIGDKVVTDPAIGYDYQIDLGAMWYEMTGLPFVFAAWVLSKEYSMPAAEERRAELETQLDWPTWPRSNIKCCMATCICCASGRRTQPFIPMQTSEFFLCTKVFWPWPALAPGHLTGGEEEAVL